MDSLTVAKIYNWFAKPLWLSPLVCARYGWINKEKDLLQCTSCKNYMTGQLPDSTDPEISEEFHLFSSGNHLSTCLPCHSVYCCVFFSPGGKCNERLVQSLVNSHHKLCPWRNFPTPGRSYPQNDPWEIFLNDALIFSVRLSSVPSANHPNAVNQFVNHASSLLSLQQRLPQIRNQVYVSPRPFVCVSLYLCIFESQWEFYPHRMKWT